MRERRQELSSHRGPPCPRPTQREGQTSCSSIDYGHHSIGLEEEEPTQVAVTLPCLETRMSLCSEGVM